MKLAQHFSTLAELFLCTGRKTMVGPGNTGLLQPIRMKCCIEGDGGMGQEWTNKKIFWVIFHPGNAQKAQERCFCPKVRGLHNSDLNAVGWKNICHQARFLFCKLVRCMWLIGLTVKVSYKVPTYKNPRRGLQYCHFPLHLFTQHLGEVEEMLNHFTVFISRFFPIFPTRLMNHSMDACTITTRQSSCNKYLRYNIQIEQSN
jgi:hypothetical protein